MDERLHAYCPECSCTLGSAAGYALAVGHAQQHARITGHVVQLAVADTWEAVETIHGEPSLPLWD